MEMPYPYTAIWKLAVKERRSKIVPTNHLKTREHLAFTPRYVNDFASDKLYLLSPPSQKSSFVSILAVGESREALTEALTSASTDQSMEEENGVRGGREDYEIRGHLKQAGKYGDELQNLLVDSAGEDVYHREAFVSPTRHKSMDAEKVDMTPTSVKLQKRFLEGPRTSKPRTYKTDFRRRNAPLFARPDHGLSSDDDFNPVAIGTGIEIPETQRFDPGATSTQDSDTDFDPDETRLH